MPGKFHGQRRLLGYSPWDSRESNVTESNESEGLSIPIVNKHADLEQLAAILYPSESKMIAKWWKAG